MREGAERLLEELHGLAVGRLRHGLLSGLPAVRQGFVPDLTPQGMVCQALNLFGHPVSGELFQGLDDARMEHPPPLLQEATVGHLVGQGMFEGIVEPGRDASRRGTRRPEGARGRGAALLGQLGNGHQKGKGTSVPMTAAVWRRRFSSDGNRSMRAASTACTVAGT